MTLTSPVDTTLTWTDGGRGVAGQAVEFATAPGGPYTLLSYVPAGQHTYHHPDLMPQTPFYYRLRPYYGPASRAVDVDLPPGGPGKQDKRDDNVWAEPRTVHGRSKVSTRSLHVPGEGAPTGLTATVMQANGIKFTWTDHARDEQGYLLEDRTRGSARYRVVAVLAPDIDSFGLSTLPDEKHASYRVRAFYYGKRSRTVHVTTGRAPDGQ
ncbi:fibronectin type III domain-containing protein [Streptomyces sp. NBC_01387]|uniref:fibronectin type III domain-containing protein n=1 Tax=unclassified Streptomyces TaxID=2593676 RepID=UPI0020251F63|nr:MULTISPECIES: fibronectin type III domain-containing protein [unclassified Streptomyces]MCX4552872.1 fibronectin type III domain-containing protein [Streptomyces sp. NBC_01500]WSV58088.1 fibronectin type III domain-containing protein [Streptomyces sp. NBC_01014]